MKTDFGREARIGQGPRRDGGVINFHIVRRLFGAESHRVNRDSPAAKRGNRIEIDPVGIVRAIAEQHHCADGQVGRFSGQLLQIVAEASGRRGRQFL